MKVAPVPCPVRHLSPISSSARCQVVPRGASVPRRIFTASCATASRTGSVANSRARRNLMRASIDEKTVHARAQPAGTPLHDEVGKPIAAFDAQRTLQQRFELGAAL